MRTPKAENPHDENIVRVPCLLQSSAREPESPSIRSSRLRLETRYGLFSPGNFRDAAQPSIAGNL